MNKQEQSSVWVRDGSGSTHDANSICLKSQNSELLMAFSASINKSLKEKVI